MLLILLGLGLYVGTARIRNWLWGNWDFELLVYEGFGLRVSDGFLQKEGKAFTHLTHDTGMTSPPVLLQALQTLLAAVDH